MKLYEYKAKEIFEKYGIPVPKGITISNSDELKEFTFPAVIKSQVLIGGRGKAGGIKFADNIDEAKAKIDEIIGMNIRGYKVNKVLVTEKVEIAKELYVSIILDRSKRAAVAITSSEGGMDIEDVPENKIFKKIINPLIGLQPYMIKDLISNMDIGKDEKKKLGIILKKLYTAFEKEDAELVEINPLVITKDNEIMAVDAKFIIDNDALYRHPEFKELEKELTPLEKKAEEKGITFIQLDGDIGVIANGAGLTMATLDTLSSYNGKGGVFLDLGGTDDLEKVKDAFRLMKEAKPSVIFLNLFGGITRCDTVALGVREVIENEGIDVPVVCRIKGLNEEKAREILKGAGLEALETIEEGARTTIELRNKSKMEVS